MSFGRFGRWIVVVVAISLLGMGVTGVPDGKRAARQSLAQGPVPDIGPGLLQVGQIEEVDLQVDHAYKIHYPGASYIKIHFRQLNLHPGESITVSDPGGLQIRTYPGDDHTTDERDGFWALSVMGDTALVQVHGRAGDEPGERTRAVPAAVIDLVAHGYPLAGIVRPESICGGDERQDVACYESTHPIEYERSDAVARLLINGTILCTAWRVGPLNRVFTNNHCVEDQTDVESTEVWFNYQRPVCGSGPITPTIVTGDTLLATDPYLDYSLFTVSRFSTITSFGYLELDVRAPVLDEEIYIPQHGGGNPKEFGIESDFGGEDVCRINDESMPGWITTTLESEAGYYCDTSGGSSGAPVLARSSHQVIALHHSGVWGSCNSTNMNQGVRIDSIWPEVASYFEAGDPAGDVRINELDLWVPDAIELYNAGSQAVDMSEWQLVIYGVNDAVQVEYTFPVFTLSPSSYVVLRGGSGSNTPTDLYLNQEISWVNGGDGAVLLLGSQGSGIDFVRFGGSTVSPSAGAGWSGVNPLSPPSGQTLGRSADGHDTDDGSDWCSQTPTLGAAGVGCAQPEIQVAPLYLQEALPAGRVTTTTMAIGNSGPAVLVFQIEPSPEDAPWLRIVPLSGVVPSMAQVDVAVVVDAAGLQAGDYTADLQILNNDADENPVVVPVTVHVRSLLYLPLVLSSGP